MAKAEAAKSAVFRWPVSFLQHYYNTAHMSASVADVLFRAWLIKTATIPKWNALHGSGKKLWIYSGTMPFHAPMHVRARGPASGADFRNRVALPHCITNIHQ